MNSNTGLPTCKKIKLISEVEENAFHTQADKIALPNCDSLNESVETNISIECNEGKIDALLHITNSETALISNERDNADDLFVFPPDNNICDMLEGTELSRTFPTVTDRYLTPYYKVNVQKPGDDICIMIHSNRICMVCIAPSHSILKMGKTITNVDFKVSDKVDRALNKVSGKGKHGAQPLQANSNICTVSCSDGQIHTIKCCMIGKLVEINDMLLKDPELLRKPPHKGGYVAVVLPNIQLLDKIKESLLTQAQYESLLVEELNNSNMADKDLNNVIMDTSQSDSNANEQSHSKEMTPHPIESS